MPPAPIRLGVHISIAGGVGKAVGRAKDLGCTAMQIFSRSPRMWKTAALSPREAAAFRRAAADEGIDPVVIHTPYLLNLAAEDEGLHRRSIAALALDVERAEEMGARFVVTHMGSTGERGRQKGLEQTVRALDAAAREDSPVTILLENSAGAGNMVGSSLEELHEIMARVDKGERFGLCFDSCHGFAAGYDFRTAKTADLLANALDRTVGRERLALLHLNDSFGELGSHLDRHAHIGQGNIGEAGFTWLLRHPAFQGVPMILETPKEGPEDDWRNLALVRRLITGEGG